MLRDDHSAYTWLFAFEGTSDTYAIQAIIYWCDAFGDPKCIMTDGLTLKPLLLKS